MRRSLYSLAVSFALVGGLAAAQPASATSTRTMSGTILGSDGRAVNVMIGFDIQDRNGKRIDMNGSQPYSYIMKMNTDVPATGGAVTSSTETRWTLRNIPAAATHVYIEVYPKARHAAYQSHPTYQGPTDQSRYGMSLRRALPASATNVALRMPVKCGVTGGVTGGIKGRVTKGGKPVKPSRVVAWSTATDSAASRKILGWNMGTIGTYQGYYQFVVPNLASGQGYTVWVTYGGRTIKKKVASFATCKSATVSYSF
jgi:hypothetical protein